MALTGMEGESVSTSQLEVNISSPFQIQQDNEKGLRELPMS